MELKFCNRSHLDLSISRPSIIVIHPGGPHIYRKIFYLDGEICEQSLWGSPGCVSTIEGKRD